MERSRTRTSKSPLRSPNGSRRIHNASPHNPKKGRLRPHAPAPQRTTNLLPGRRHEIRHRRPRNRTSPRRRPLHPAKHAPRSLGARRHYRARRLRPSTRRLASQRRLVLARQRNQVAQAPTRAHQNPPTHELNPSRSPRQSTQRVTRRLLRMDPRRFRFLRPDVRPSSHRQRISPRRRPHRPGHHRQPRHAPPRRVPLRPASRSLRPPPPANARHSFLFRSRSSLRLRPKFHSLSDSAIALRHRHGRRMGRRRIASPGIRPSKMARPTLRSSARRLRAWLSTSRSSLLDRLPPLGLASPIFPRRRSGAAHSLHPRKSKRKRRLAGLAQRASRLARLRPRSLRQSPPLPLSGNPDGRSKFHFPRHSRSLPNIPPATTRLQPETDVNHHGSLNGRRNLRRASGRPTLRSLGTPPLNGRRSSRRNSVNPTLGFRAKSSVDSNRRLHLTIHGPRRLGRNPRPHQRTLARSPTRLLPRFRLSNRRPNSSLQRLHRSPPSPPSRLRKSHGPFRGNSPNLRRHSNRERPRSPSHKIRPLSRLVGNPVGEGPLALPPFGHVSSSKRSRKSQRSTRCSRSPTQLAANSAVRIGNDLTRFPVAIKIAFPKAGAKESTPNSPSPLGASSLVTK